MKNSIKLTYKQRQTRVKVHNYLSNNNLSVYDMTGMLLVQSGHYIILLYWKVPMATNKNQIASFVKDYNIKSAQIEYLSKSPSSILTRLDPNFTSHLEAQANPAHAYSSALKQLYMEQLGLGVREKAGQRREEEIREAQFRSGGDYQSRVNGVLCELEKNSLTHSLLLQRKLNQQEQRGQKFIDEDRLKGEKINHFIEAREDRDVFNHESDLYQQYQRNELQHSLSLLQLQKDNKAQENERARQQRQREYEQRMEFERQLQCQRRQDRENRIQNQMKYQSELQGMVQQKKQKQLLSRDTSNSSPQKHNPITNPIEYHIENPYLLKRMAQRQAP